MCSNLPDITDAIGGLDISPTKVLQKRKSDTDLENIPKFVTHSVPPCDRNTRLIAVCGVTDRSEQLTECNLVLPPGKDHPTVKRGRCDPKVEGWFISDFYGFKNLYKGTCASQVWIHCEDPQALINAYGQYLHGNPRKDRKVVLDQALLNDGLGHDMILVPRHQLKEQFCQLLQREAELARQNGQSLLVMTMSHGREETFSVNLGELDNPHDWFKIEDFKNAVIAGPSLQKGDNTTDLKITYLSTACFSGGWTIQEDLNMTIFAAAGPAAESVSWLRSPSCGRYSGGIYTTAIMQAWNKESQAVQASQSSSASSSTQKTLAGFDKEIYETLFRIDKYAQEHDIRFTAQDDNRDSPWTERTRFPLISFKEKWDQLRTVPPSNPGGAANPSPSNKQGSDRKPSQAIGGFHDRFESVSSAREFVMFQANVYLKSFPGAGNAASNTTLHGTLHRLQSRKGFVTVSQLDGISLQIRFRLALSHQATWLVKAAKLPLPGGKSCDQWNEEEDFKKKMREQPTSPTSQRYSVAVQKIFGNVLPEPTQAQGLPWHKAKHYIAAAIACDNTVANKNQILERVQVLEKLAADDLNPIQKDLDCIPEICQRKRDLFAKIGKRVRSLSPDRIRRKRADTGAAKLGTVPEYLSPPTPP